jgi:glycyl-tRNA synthetase alpha subunit
MISGLLKTTGKHAVGAWGVGWEVWLDRDGGDAPPIFSSAAELIAASVSIEITYGLAADDVSARRDAIAKIQWNDSLNPWRCSPAR